MTLYDLYWAWKLRGPPSTHTEGKMVRRFVRHVGRESEARALTEARIVAYLSEFRTSIGERRSDVWRNTSITIRRWLNYGVRVGALPFNPMRRLLLPIWNSRIKQSRPRLMRPESARPQSLGGRPLTSVERRELAEIEEELRHEGVSTVRPRTTAECPPDSQPCPWAGCRHHLGVEVQRYGGTGTEMVKLNRPGVDVAEMPTCSLRAAAAFGARGRHFRTKGTLQVVASADEVASLLNLTPERIFQLEREALAKLRRALGPEAIGG